MGTRHLFMKTVFIALSVFCMSSCQLFENSITYHKPIEPLNTHLDEEGSFYIRKSSFSQSYFDICNTNTKYLSPIGKQKILVIPVEFSDYLAHDLKGGAENALINIHNAFFGKKEATFYESVAAYYNKSSYGQLELTGKVSPWFSLNKTVQEVADMSYIIKSQYILEQAVEWYRKNFDDIQDFDQDNDGYIDAVWLVSSAPYDEINKDQNDLLWAHTYNSKSTSKYTDRPYASMYSYASYNFLFHSPGSGINEKADSHVYIHETGHMLGLKDYYPETTSSSVSNSYYATSRFDMMDANIGDHNAFSKMMLNWTTPYVIKDEGTFELHSFEKTGQCIVISSDWNNHPLDEYLLLEYYTPTGLQKDDAKVNWTYKNLNKRGLRVYHVDARLGYITNAGNNTHAYYEDVENEVVNLPQDINTYHFDFANCNTLSKTYKHNLLISFLWASNFENEGAPATNDLLYQKGSSFDDRLNYTKEPFVFNSNKEVPYSFKIDDISKDKITISFYKVK